MPILQGASMLSKKDGIPMFDGNDTPALQRNYQEVLYQLANGDKIQLETFAFHLDGSNIAMRGKGYSLPIYRTLEIKKKGLFKGKTILKGDEFKGIFEVLNNMIRNTRLGKSNIEKHGDNALVRLCSYEHAHYERMEYYNVTDDLPLGGITEFVLSCRNGGILQKRIVEVTEDPHWSPFLERTRQEMSKKLERYRKQYSGQAAS